jgi:hypothetical protein
MTKPVTDEFIIYWMVPSKFYAGSFVPRWEKVDRRDVAIGRARLLIETGVTDRVTLRSVEVIT